MFVLFCVRNETLSASTSSRNDYLKDIQKKVLLDVLELNPSLEHKNRYENSSKVFVIKYEYSEHYMLNDQLFLFNTSHLRQIPKMIVIPNDMRELYKERTGQDVPKQYRQKRTTEMEAPLPVQELVGNMLTESNSIASKAIFDFDFDPLIYNSSFTQGIVQNTF
jgi:hypothetical protein